MLARTVDVVIAGNDTPKKVAIALAISEERAQWLLNKLEERAALRRVDGVYRALTPKRIPRVVAVQLVVRSPSPRSRLNELSSTRGAG